MFSYIQYKADFKICQLLTVFNGENTNKNDIFKHDFYVEIGFF